MPVSALILVEMTSLLVPTGEAGKMERKGLVLEGMAEASKKKKDKWSSRADAKAWMARHMPWKAWDARALDSFVVRVLFIHLISKRECKLMCAYANVLYVLKAYGLRDLPTAFYPDDKTGGVTLSCYKVHESDSFSNFNDPVMAANYLVNVTKLIPVHVIFGQKSLFRYALAYYPVLLM